MGILKATLNSIGGTFSEQWLESVEPAQLDNSIIVTYGVVKGKKNNKGGENVISNGSVIHVPDNVYMLLVDGGKIIAATDEPGYFKVDNSRSPSIFFESEKENYELGSYDYKLKSKRDGIIRTLINESWDRFKFSGGTPVNQQVIYINKQEIPNVRFGTKTPVPYTDRVLVPGRPVPCKITSFGTYSIKVADPILFYKEVCAKVGKKNLEITDLAEHYINEFLMAYQTSLASLSMQNVCISDISIKTMELGLFMAETLDKEWLAKRGFCIESVGIAGISFDENTDKLLDRYANDSILFDANARSARMTEGMATGLSAAGSNGNGAMFGFAGMNMGMGMANAMGAMPNQQQADYNPSQTCNANMNQGAIYVMCECGNQLDSNSKFCSNCGRPKPSSKLNTSCSKCNWTPTDINNTPKFCPNCGSRFNVER